MLKKQDRGYANSLFLSSLRDLYIKNKFAKYTETYPRGLPFILQDQYYILEDAIDWITTRLPEIPQPFLGYFHLLPPHEPYRTRIDFTDKFRGDNFRPIDKPGHLFSNGYSQQSLNEQRRLYDEYILFVDHEFGWVLDSLEQAGVLDNTYVIFTADHREMFDLVNDPEELMNVYTRKPEIAKILREELEERIIQADKPYAK